MTQEHDAKALLKGTTPGPWSKQTIREQTGFRMVKNYVLDSVGDIVAHVFANGSAEEEATARLIAAAPDLARQVITLTTRAETAEAEVKRLRDGLWFYANPNNWRSVSMYMCGHSGGSNVSADGGNRARALLKDQGE